MDKSERTLDAMNDAMQRGAAPHNFNYNKVEVEVEDTVGAITLSIVTLALMFVTLALIRQNRALVEALRRVAD